MHACLPHEVNLYQWFEKPPKHFACMVVCVCLYDLLTANLELVQGSFGRYFRITESARHWNCSVTGEEGIGHCEG